MKAELTHIAHGKLCVLELETAQEIRVASGRIWLTEAGRPVDFVLETGQIHLTETRARILIEAEDEAWLSITSAPRNGLTKDANIPGATTFVQAEVA